MSKIFKAFWISMPDSNYKTPDINYKIFKYT